MRTPEEVFWVHFKESLDDYEDEADEFGTEKKE